MYIVPNIRPAPTAAAIPATARGGDEEASWDDAYPRRTAPNRMALAPPTTFAQLAGPAPRSSRKKNQPQKTPTKLFTFHKGKAMESPTSRTAKIVRVFPTAQRDPARTAQITRCDFSRRS